MKYEITVDGTTHLVDVQLQKDGRYTVRLDDQDHVVDLQRPSPEAFHMLIDGESWEAGCVPSADGFLVDVVGVTTPVQVVDPRRKALRLASAATSGLVSTTMPGRVVRVLVAAGDKVRKGQPVIVVEAMKMENELKSPVDGVVLEVLATEGQTVEANTKLVRIEG